MANREQVNRGRNATTYQEWITTRIRVSEPAGVARADAINQVRLANPKAKMVAATKQRRRLSTPPKASDVWQIQVRYSIPK